MVLWLRGKDPCSQGLPRLPGGCNLIDPVVQRCQSRRGLNCHHRGCKRAEGATGCDPQVESKGTGLWGQVGLHSTPDSTLIYHISLRHVPKFL